jgi:uncharacterized RDD family membrane protein YckC
MEQSNETGFLQELEQEIYLEPVSPGVRFVNYLIDYITVVGLMVVIFVVIAASTLTDAELIESASQEEAMGGFFTQYLIAALCIIGYYTIFEFASKGRTLGKLITGTVAVKDDGGNLTFKDALVRSVCRLIPFEPFSAFGGRPWHDTISNTMVIKKPK